MTNIYDFQANSISGQPIDLSDFKGKVVLVVNTASKCGLTPQYEGLEALYREYKDQGLEILGFPCDQFGHQEPGAESEIASFCQRNYGVSFTMFEKIEVNGDGAHPLFQYLQEALPGFMGNKLKWNFTKFLIGPDGTPVKRYAPTDKPEKLRGDIQSQLKAVAS